MKVELEARYYAVNDDAIRSKLEKLSNEKVVKGEGLRVRLALPRKSVRRIVWDIDPSKGKFLRLREGHGYTEMTLKYVKNPATIDGTYERTVSLRGRKFTELAPLFRNIGLGLGSYQETERESWRWIETSDGLTPWDAAYGDITFDYWPGLKPIVEIEVLKGGEEMIEQLESELQLPKRFQGDIPDIYAQEYNMTREEFNKIPSLTNIDFPEIPFK